MALEANRSGWWPCPAQGLLVFDLEESKEGRVWWWHRVAISKPAVHANTPLSSTHVCIKLYCRFIQPLCFFPFTFPYRWSLWNTDLYLTGALWCSANASWMKVGVSVLTGEAPPHRLWLKFSSHSSIAFPIRPTDCLGQVQLHTAQKLQGICSRVCGAHKILEKFEGTSPSWTPRSDSEPAVHGSHLFAARLASNFRLRDYNVPYQLGVPALLPIPRRIERSEHRDFRDFNCSSPAASA